mmetsp:Transcript_20929/g.55432  ORF Transcript_20929/g.55432 Transcript_20929/m.55432 type:complete len:218 (+) Transcript_20929:60-713(+)
MKLRWVSCTASREACHAQTPQKAQKARMTAATTGFFTRMGAKVCSMKRPTRPPLCAGGAQQSWFGSLAPPMMAFSASSLAVTGQQGHPLRQMHGQQSIRLAATRRASNVASAAKKKICSRKSAAMEKAAYMQKAERAGRAEDTEMAKATKSVTDVTMIETPAWERAEAMRLGTGSVGSVWSKAFMMTKESSTPMPRITKGRTPCTGVYGNPSHMERP